MSLWANFKTPQGFELVRSGLMDLGYDVEKAEGIFRDEKHAWRITLKNGEKTDISESLSGTRIHVHYGCLKDGSELRNDLLALGNEEERLKQEGKFSISVWYYDRWYRGVFGLKKRRHHSH